MDSYQCRYTHTTHATECNSQTSPLPESVVSRLGLACEGICLPITSPASNYETHLFSMSVIFPFARGTIELESDSAAARIEERYFLDFFFFFRSFNRVGEKETVSHGGG